MRVVGAQTRRLVSTHVAPLPKYRSHFHLPSLRLNASNGVKRIGFMAGTSFVVRAAMFDNLTKSLTKAWDLIQKDSKLTPENIKGPIREVRRALLEADVSLPVVRRFVKSVETSALGVKVIKGVTPMVQFVKVVSDELTALMGGERSVLAEPDVGPQIILLAGLQGVGKTTVSAKIARYLQKVLLIAADVYRPAAIDQLAKLGEKIDVEVFRLDDEANPVQIVKMGLEYARSIQAESVIVDTAGRLQINEELMNELREMKESCNPSDILLVVDAMTGQEAAALVKSFNELLELTGAILTKMDGDSRGGAALSVYEVSRKPIKFVSTGENVDSLEAFYPARMSSRILGMGDMLTLYEKADAVIKEEEAAELTRKMMEAKFDFNDFIKQYEMMSNMGSMASVMKLMPGMAEVTEKQIYEAEKQFKIYDSLVKSMTKDERANPDVLARSASRRRRIAKGSGRSEFDVSNLIGTFVSMRRTMQNVMRMMALQQGAANIPGMPSMSNEELVQSMVESSTSKIPPGMVRRRKQRQMKSVAERKVVR